MKQYCKAYHLADLRRFAGWKEVPPADGSRLTDETIVYLWDDLSVVASPVAPERAPLWESRSGDWERFCREELEFAIPEDLRDD
jgi:hypothetical protein